MSVWLALLLLLVCRAADWQALPAAGRARPAPSASFRYGRMRQRDDSLAKREAIVRVCTVVSVYAAIASSFFLLGSVGSGSPTKLPPRASSPSGLPSLRHTRRWPQSWNSPPQLECAIIEPVNASHASDASEDFPLSTSTNE